MDLEAVVPQPVDASVEGPAFADDDGLESELADQAGAVPAGRERGDHNEVAVGALTSGVAEGVSLSVGGWVVVLDAAVVSRAQERAIGAEDRGSDGDASFGETLACFGDSDSEHGFGGERDRHALQVN